MLSIRKCEFNIDTNKINVHNSTPVRINIYMLGRLKTEDYFGVTEIYRKNL